MHLLASVFGIILIAAAAFAAYGIPRPTDIYAIAGAFAEAWPTGNNFIANFAYSISSLLLGVLLFLIYDGLGLFLNSTQECCASTSNSSSHARDLSPS